MYLLHVHGKLEQIFTQTEFQVRSLQNCQAQVRSPKVQSPKVKTKGTWADTKITWATTPPLPGLDIVERQV